MNPLNQRYLLRINGVDVTSEVSGDVVYESNPDVVSSLSFTLKGERFSTSVDKQGRKSVTAKDVVKLLDKIDFEGGAGYSDNYGHVFRGFVKYIRPTYSDSGVFKVNIEAVDYSFRGAMNRTFHSYPSTTSDSRQWAVKSEITASDIIRGIVKDMGLTFAQHENQDDLRLLSDRVFNLRTPLTQRNESDWQLLRKLAGQLNCNFWTSYVDGNSVIHFVDKSFLRDESNSGETVFLYPLRSGPNFVFTDKKPGQILIREVDVEQDFAAMDETKKVITTFDYNKGEEVTVFEAKVVEQGKEISKYFTFELDEAKVSALAPDQRRDLENIASSIAGGEAAGYTINDIAPFFKPASFLDDRRNFLVDKPYFGITVRATIDGNLGIIPRKNYTIYGLGRYGSESLQQKYYLRSLTHRWGSSGFLTNLEFIR